MEWFRSQFWICGSWITTHLERSLAKNMNSCMTVYRITYICCDPGHCSYIPLLDRGWWIWSKWLNSKPTWSNRARNIQVSFFKRKVTWLYWENSLHPIDANIGLLLTTVNQIIGRHFWSAYFGFFKFTLFGNLNACPMFIFFSRTRG